MTEEPLRHVLRPQVPWTRRPALTECGRRADELADAVVVTHDQALALIRKYGKQRAAFMLCMTCASTASRHRSGSGWGTRPSSVVQRHLPSMWGQTDPLRSEWHALAWLVERHREEFDQYLGELESTADIAAARQRVWRRRRGLPDE